MVENTLHIFDGGNDGNTVNIESMLLPPFVATTILISSSSSSYGGND
jgi:hypothetical protein